MKIYLDMDGVLVDFIRQVEKYDFFRKDKPDKVDWKKVKAMGPVFWSEMDWMPGAEDAFKKLQVIEKNKGIDLYILSSIDFTEGIEGKKNWISQHTCLEPEKLILVKEPEDKAEYAGPDAVLVDDRDKSLIPFKNAGGKTIKFKDWDSTIKEIEKL